MKEVLLFLQHKNVSRFLFFLAGEKSRKSRDSIVSILNRVEA